MVRIKHRYLLLHVLYPHEEVHATGATLKTEADVPYTVQFRRPSADSFDAKLLMRLVREGVSELFGDYGSGMIAGSLQVKYCSPATSTAIIRVARDHYQLVWAALTMTTRLPKPLNQACVIQVVRVSGTIKKAEEEAIMRARLSIERARKAAASSGVATDPHAHQPMKPSDDSDANNDNEMDFAKGIEDLDVDEDSDGESV